MGESKFQLTDEEINHLKNITKIGSQVEFPNARYNERTMVKGTVIAKYPHVCLVETETGKASITWKDLFIEGKVK